MKEHAPRAHVIEVITAPGAIIDAPGYNVLDCGGKRNCKTPDHLAASKCTERCAMEAQCFEEVRTWRMDVHVLS